MTNKFNELIRILGHETVLNAVLSGLTNKSLEHLANSVAAEYNISFDPYDYTKDEVFLELSDDERNIVETELKKLYDYKCLQDRSYITDSTYYDISDEFAGKYNYEFNDDNGYPEIVYSFSNLAWKIIHNSKYI